ncbi:MAG TPA: cyclic pyranopterin monophosphate synthase MoaC [Planctomycetota bacterium]|nr:cyclic pyranopterin monophosphate synthase MoaC [Planctomycetota bacterium]
MDELSHVDDAGRAKMVDVGGKTPQRRIARAAGRIDMSASTVELIRTNQMKKGDVLTVAKVAGLQAAKRTAELIPLCHPLTLDLIDVRLELADGGVTATSEVRCIGRTGVEMEALTAVSVALLTVYDMCKAADRAMCITDVRLIEKVKEDVEEG